MPAPEKPTFPEIPPWRPLAYFVAMLAPFMLLRVVLSGVGIEEISYSDFKHRMAAGLLLPGVLLPGVLAREPPGRRGIGQRGRAAALPAERGPHRRAATDDLRRRPRPLSEARKKRIESEEHHANTDPHRLS